MRMILALSLALGLATPAHAQVGLHAGSHFGIGQMGTDSTANPDRALGLLDVQVMPGWRFPSKFMAGVLLDYRFITQLDETPNAGNPNLAGQSLHLGLGGTYESGDVKLLVSYDPVVRHWVSSPSATLKGSGFHFLVGIQFDPGWFVDLQFSTASYDEAGILGIDQHLEPSLKHWNLGLGMSYSFNSTALLAPSRP